MYVFLSDHICTSMTILLTYSYSFHSCGLDFRCLACLVYKHDSGMNHLTFPTKL